MHGLVGVTKKDISNLYTRSFSIESFTLRLWAGCEKAQNIKMKLNYFAVYVIIQ
jgi:hypothetical protein